MTWLWVSQIVFDVAVVFYVACHAHQLHWPGAGRK